jgi:putative lipoprotein (rSAM/lipoprotein system)
MKTTNQRKQKIIRKLLGTLSFTSALFVFQACYGMPRDTGIDVQIRGTVKSAKTNLPIEGIKVYVSNHEQYVFSDGSGNFVLYTEKADSYLVKFEDIDADNNGAFATKDTTIKNVYNSIEVALDTK